MNKFCLIFCFLVIGCSLPKKNMNGKLFFVNGTNKIYRLELNSGKLSIDLERKDLQSGIMNINKYNDSSFFYCYNTFFTQIDGNNDTNTKKINIYNHKLKKDKEYMLGKKIKYNQESEEVFYLIAQKDSSVLYNKTNEGSSNFIYKSNKPYLYYIPLNEQKVIFLNDENELVTYCGKEKKYFNTNFKNLIPLFFNHSNNSIYCYHYVTKNLTRIDMNFKKSEQYSCKLDERSVFIPEQQLILYCVDNISLSLSETGNLHCYDLKTNKKYLIQKDIIFYEAVYYSEN